MLLFSRNSLDSAGYGGSLCVWFWVFGMGGWSIVPVVQKLLVRELWY